MLPNARAPLARGAGRASRRDIEGAPGGVPQATPVASIRHVRLACQPDVDLTAAKPHLEVEHVQANRGVVTGSFLAEIDALPGWIPELPEAAPGEIVQKVAVHPATPVQHAGNAVGLD